MNNVKLHLGKSGNSKIYSEASVNLFKEENLKTRIMSESNLYDNKLRINYGL